MKVNPLEFLDDPALQVLAAVERAAHLARRIRQETVVPVSKPDRTPLTIADLAVQAVIGRALEEHGRPRDGSRRQPARLQRWRTSPPQ